MYIQLLMPWSIGMIGPMSTPLPPTAWLKHAALLPFTPLTLITSMRR